jgi:hypothetical protein
MGYSYFSFFPKLKATKVFNEFELAVRNENNEKIKQLISSSESNSFLEIVNRPGFKTEFNKFETGITIKSCVYIPAWSERLTSRNRDEMVIEAKMKAKLDGKYREYFPGLLVKENTKWKIKFFYFPDYIDY